MKKSIPLVFLLVVVVNAGGLKLNKMWETDPVMITAESVNYDARRDVLYVSCINGTPTAKDGNGFIARIKPGGKLLNEKWVTGLNAPKGAAIVGNFLFVTDIDHLVKIDILKGKIVGRFPAPGSQFLNDAAADKDGNVYISDSSSVSTIYKFDGKKVSVWLTDKRIQHPNGLLRRGDTLLVGNGGNGKIFAVSFKDKTIKSYASSKYGVDGLKRAPGGNFIVSDWAGHIGQIAKDGSYHLLLDTSGEKINAADLEVIVDWKMLYIPTFFHNTVACYMIQELRD